jgi:hypothetical protein
MRTSSKILLIVGGFLTALAIAWIVVKINISATSGPDRDTSGGMYAFGDSILFLGVFAVAALPATGATLYFLRPHPLFWRLFTAGALTGTATGILVLADFLVPRSPTTGTLLGTWSMVSPLRVLVAPILAAVFLLSALFAPTRFTRIAFLSATAVEALLFVWVAFIWIHSTR